MIARTAHRARPAAAAAVAEVKRLRGQLAAVTAQRDQLARQLADLLEATSSEEAQVTFWRQLAADTAAAAAEEGEARGYQLAEADQARAWRHAAAPVTRGGPDLAALELLRWGPDGREHFGDPRPGDFPGRGETGGEAR